ncbi:MAG: UDP-N-acetylglucosamine diphosphorylase/glucosamine-1-phosphate N-acetyltransferase [Nevskiaceae bacterium]|nr:MAG: UDP-N-acetylglucosamine diphosphorylase/glucosamine-1-phosphate N-acetyltransferase [Nevskiaceae bacterium]
MTVSIHTVILAAGQGTRMKSALPKVLHTVGGKPMLAHVLETARAAGAAAFHVVHGHGAEQVQAAFAQVEGLHWTLQAQQLGTGHAVQQSAPDVPDDALLLVLYGDVPLISVDTLKALTAAATDTLAIVTVELAQPRGYGRILRDERQRVTGIVEEKDASDSQRRITEVNSGLMAAPAKLLKRWLGEIKNHNANGEYYLTDVVGLAVRDGLTVNTVKAAKPEEVEGVNDRAQLARAERVYQRTQAERLMREGVNIVDPARFDLRGMLLAGKDVKLDVGVIIEGVCEFGDNVRIGPYCVIKNAKLGDNTEVEAHSVLDGVNGGAGLHIGPFARLRPGTELADGAKVGNFVETKKTRVGKGSKINHLSYVGDAVLGEDVNVGAGTITCNYDGVNKHETRIGDRAFIGSNSALVAPVSIGAGATIGAGSVIGKDAPDGALTVARAKQVTVPGWKRPTKKA